MTVRLKSINASRALEALGANIKTARSKRRISVRSFAERVGVSESTVIRLEKGDSGVSLGTLAMACLVLGEIERISDFLDSGSDETGLLLDKDKLPKRIDRKRGSRASIPNKRDNPASDEDDAEGIGF